MCGAFGGKEVVSGIKTLNTLWTGRFVSTRPPECSEKCEMFNPNKPCCRAKSDILDDLLLNPTFHSHPLNVFHSRIETPLINPSLKQTSKLPDSPSIKLELDCDADDD
jgi:hypothetical protein